MEIKSLKPFKSYFDLPTTLVFLISLFIFILFLLLRIPTDIQVHAEIVKNVAEGKIDAPANFMYYLFVYILALTRTSKAYLYLSSAVILSTSVTLKYIVTKHILRESFFTSSASKLSNSAICEIARKRVDAVTTLYSFMLVFSFSLPLSIILGLNNKYYLGNIPPNIWHNSTTILLFPIALLTFWLSYIKIKYSKKEGSILLTLLIVIGLLIKPSYFFIFMICFPIMIMLNSALRKRLFVELLPVGVGLSVLILQYILIYYYQAGNIYDESSSIAIRPLFVWSSLSENIPLSLVGSLIFPLTCLVLLFRESVSSLFVRYSVFQYFIGLLIFITFSETGAREFHGNFIWQSIISTYVLFIAFCYLSMKITMKSILSFEINLSDPATAMVFFKEVIKKIPTREKLLFIALFLHFFAGIIYILKIFFFRNYG